MGCRCCKMIQSYLFEPVHAPPAGYVNEVNSYKLEEEDGIKSQSKESQEILARTEAKNRLNSAQEPFWHHRGPPTPGDPPAIMKADPTLNGVGSGTAPSPGVRPRLSQGHETPPQESGGGSLASAVSDGDSDGHSATEGDPEERAAEETRVILNGDSHTSGESACSPGGHHTLEGQDHILQLPVPDYPQVEVQVVSQNAEESGHFLSNHIQPKPMDRADFADGDQPAELAFSKGRSWDSLHEAIKTEALTVNFNKDVMKRDPDWSSEQEDAAVAEALAALEAATAGEDGEEGY
ncbi:PDCD10 and GCKIII kinases-associated protein 1 [Sminthopsis crassicaudata]|uniref:PDCD10 and GCKIII kinases-associated protein 1 n=1 Tax=Sminthopsis crassicaudata TaxID=9301 RepID=UPI003D68127B